jgi:hypothetical protein
MTNARTGFDPNRVKVPRGNRFGKLRMNPDRKGPDAA